ncbi:RNA polymerase I enhancer binding protein [Ascochyta rabiei]|uniref:Chromatin binding n=1 Tax=Didymella rabiei TaxID=5454 RepID=A0A163CGC0_DIDRA|nr:RNA polymerase I enhancer binding protein [Ascochyta rabiei]KZM22442.1 chromatin binding [Ascochyta rabiei]UPX09386.1 RNA polymerase I enhancer binding protein [Ascochyta rabiei]
MGVSSSQPFPSSQDPVLSSNTAKNVTTPSLAERVPRCTPTMDDEAASQQLMSEARALHTTDHDGPAIPLLLDGASQDTITKTPGSSAKKAKKPRRKPPTASHNNLQDAFPGSSLPSYSLKELQAFVGPSPSKKKTSASTIPSTQIEVPATQTESQLNTAPSTTPLTTSQAATTSSSKKKKSGKGKENTQAQTNLHNDMQEEKTQPDVGSPSAGVKARNPRRKRQALNSQAELADTLIEQDTIPATPYEKTTEEPIAPPSNPIEGQTSQKRRRKNKPHSSVNSPDFDSNKIVETSIAEQEEAPGATAEGSRDHVGASNAEEQPLIPMALLDNLKAERLQSSPAGSALRKTQKLPENKSDAEAEADLPDAVETTTPIKTPGTAQSTKKRKRSRKDKQAPKTPLLDWDPPVRSLDDPPTQPFNYEDMDELELLPENDNQSDSKTASCGSRRKRKSTNSKKASRPSVGGLARTPSHRSSRSRADPNRNYQRDHDDDGRTAAEIALDSSHELGQPPDKRTSGEYTADEKELLRRAIRDYQERNGLEVADLVEIIQWTHVRRKEMGSNTTDQTEEQYKRDSSVFWDDVGSAGLMRQSSDIKRHVRARYHTCRRGHWSQEEDEILRELADSHPGQWKLVATQLNRLELDVYNRWKDYVRHGESRMTKRWSKDEEEKFVKVLSTVCQRVEDHLAETGKPPLDDYTPVINWHEVCREMGDTRSRLQCQSKWKQMRAREPPATVGVEIKPRKTPEPGQVGVEEPQKKRDKSRAKKEGESAGAIAEASPLGPEDMLWGDKFDLVGHVVEQVVADGCETESQIVWQDIAEQMKQTWSVRTLQKAYKELRELVDEQEDLTASLGALLAYMNENHKSEMDDRYIPLPELDAGGEDAPVSHSSQKRKRMSGVGSGKSTAKRNKKGTPSTTKAYKSKELITDSDNAESEVEG